MPSRHDRLEDALLALELIKLLADGEASENLTRKATLQIIAQIAH